MLADDVLQGVIDIKVQRLDLGGVGLVTEVVPVLQHVAEVQGQVMGPGVVVQPQETAVVILQTAVCLAEESFPWGQGESVAVKHLAEGSFTWGKGESAAVKHLAEDSFTWGQEENVAVKHLAEESFTWGQGECCCETPC